MIKKILPLGVMLTVFMSLAPMTFADSDLDSFVPISIQSIEGSLSSVDDGDQNITVHWMYDRVMMKYKDMSVEVAENAVIKKNGQKIRLRDLRNGDHATVRINPNTVPLPTAVAIIVEE